MRYAGEITTLSFDYDIACSTASFLSGLLLASLCLRALRLERRRGALGSPVDSQSHQPALLQILLFVGLTDAYYAAGWMLLVVAQGYPHLSGLPPTPPAVCRLANIMTFSGEVSQAAWTVVLAWYIGRVLHDGRPAEDWRKWRGQVHLVVWGATLGFLAVFVIFVLPLDTSCSRSWPPHANDTTASNSTAGGDSAQTTPILFAGYAVVPFATVMYVLVMYARVVCQWRRLGAGNLTHVFRLTSYLAAYLVCQLAVVVCALVDVVDPASARAHGLTGWAGPGLESPPGFRTPAWWTAMVPLQGVVDLLVYVHHICRNSPDCRAWLTRRRGGGLGLAGLAGAVSPRAWGGGGGGADEPAVRGTPWSWQRTSVSSVNSVDVPAATDGAACGGGAGAMWSSVRGSASMRASHSLRVPLAASVEEVAEFCEEQRTASQTAVPVM